MKESEREVTIREFTAEPEYTIAVSERLQEELVLSKTINHESEIKFELLYQLTRAMSNILILTQD